jgi:hypothetical protein
LKDCEISTKAGYPPCRFEGWKRWAVSVYRKLHVLVCTHDPQHEPDRNRESLPCRIATARREYVLHPLGLAAVRERDDEAVRHSKDVYGRTKNSTQNKSALLQLRVLGFRLRASVRCRRAGRGSSDQPITPSKTQPTRLRCTQGWRKQSGNSARLTV